MAKLILIGAPPACGKTYYSRKIAKQLPGSLFLDLDVLNPLSKRLCELCGQPFEKGGDFFSREVREAEYETLLELVFLSLESVDTVIVCAPFSREFRCPERMGNIEKRCEAVGVALVPVWILSDQAHCYKNMRQRNELRDQWKLDSFDAYIQGIRFDIPEGIRGLRVLDVSASPDEEELLKNFLETI